MTAASSSAIPSSLPLLSPPHGVVPALGGHVAPQLDLVAPAINVTAKVLTAFNRQMLIYINAQDFPHTYLANYNKIFDEKPAPRTIDTFGCTKHIYTIKEMEEVAAPRRKIFFELVQMFSHYRENDRGVLTLKSNPNYVFKKELTTLKLLRVAEAFFAKATGQAMETVTETDLKTEGALYEEDNEHFLFAMTRKCHILQCANVGNDVFAGLDQVGSGSYGNVYKILDVVSGLFDAIKIASCTDDRGFEDFNGPGSVSNFEATAYTIKEESKKLRALQNTAVAPYVQSAPHSNFDLTTKKGQRIVGFVGKLYKDDLSNWCERSHGYEARLKVCAKLLNIFKQLHQHEVVHRDIKPNNFFYEGPEDDPRIVLGDFGVALSEDGDVLPPAENYGSQDDYTKFQRVFAYRKAVNIIIGENGPHGDELIADSWSRIKNHYFKQEVYTLGVTLFNILTQNRYPYDKGIKTKAYADFDDVFDFSEILRRNCHSDVYAIVKRAVSISQKARAKPTEMVSAWNKYLAERAERHSKAKESDEKHKASGEGQSPPLASAASVRLLEAGQSSLSGRKRKAGAPMDNPGTVKKDK